MKKESLIGSVVNPCQYGWDSMQGNDTIRYCDLCKLNVYNLSQMTKEEATHTVQQIGESLCVQIRRRPDGSIYTDNCPYKLRRLRNWLRTYAPYLLIVFASIFNQAVADAQGLAGAAVGGRFGQSNEVIDEYSNTVGFFQLPSERLVFASISSGFIAWIKGVKDVCTAENEAHKWAAIGGSPKVIQLLLKREWLRSIFLLITVPIIVLAIGSFFRL